MLTEDIKKHLKKVRDGIYEIPTTFRPDMRVPARVFASEEILNDIYEDRSLEQLVNVATLPGIVKQAMAMPDIHQGYGFPIGGVAATDINNKGVISPGGIGYDICCSVRLLASNKRIDEVEEKLEDIASAISRAIPSGMGRGGKTILSLEELDKILKNGAKELVAQGYGTERDLEFCESNGFMPNAKPENVSDRAKERGKDQLGTLGSGNHFLEVQVVEDVFDEEAAKTFGLYKGQVVIMIHTGSRGLGHQTCTDYVRKMVPMIKEWGIKLPDRELACAPFESDLGQAYYHAMAAAANFSWANKHMIAHNIRREWHYYFGENAPLNLVYDVAHNIGKVEKHIVDGKKKTLLVHRKGATRAFPAHHPEIPRAYKEVGQPVFVPGTMGTASYVLVGTEEGMELTFGSSCHGAGRRLSRKAAKKKVQGPDLRKQLEEKGIIVRCTSNAELAEEAPIAYKDIENVIDVITSANLAKKVVRLRPRAVVKGD